MSARKLVYTALLAALTAVGAFIRIPIGISVITMQFLFTAMAGVLLGPGGGAEPGGLCGSGACGAADRSPPEAASGYVLQPLSGSCWADSRRRRHRRSEPPQQLAGEAGPGLWGGAGGSLCRGGALYGADPQRLSGQGHQRASLLWSGMLIYLPGDAAKIAVTALLCPVLRRRVPGLR